MHNFPSQIKRSSKIKFPHPALLNGVGGGWGVILIISCRLNMDCTRTETHLNKMIEFQCQRSNHQQKVLFVFLRSFIQGGARQQSRDVNPKTSSPRGPVELKSRYPFMASNEVKN